MRRPPRERVGGPGRPGAPAGRALPALGRELPGPEEPAPAGPRRGAAPRGGGRRAGLVLLGDRGGGGGPADPRGDRGGRHDGRDPDARLSPGPGRSGPPTPRRPPWSSPRSARASASPPSRRWPRASPSRWPTRPPCPRSAARRAGTSDPSDEEAIARPPRLLDHPGERARRVIWAARSPDATVGRPRMTSWSRRSCRVRAGRPEIAAVPLLRPTLLRCPFPKDRHRPIDGRDVGRLVEPSADAGGMGERKIADAVADRGGADDVG